jgi:hypothetical protein
MPDEPIPYTRLPEETAKAHHAFVIYRNMGEGRSLREVSRILNLKGPRHLKIWAAKYHWEARCKTFDNTLEDQKIQIDLDLDREGYLKKLRKYIELHQSIGLSGLIFASQFLYITTSQIEPLTQKVKNKQSLTPEEMDKLNQLRRCRDIAPIAELSSLFMAESLQISRVIKHLEAIKLEAKS